MTENPSKIKIQSTFRADDDTLVLCPLAQENVRVMEKAGLLNAYSYKTITLDNGEDVELRNLNFQQITRFSSSEKLRWLRSWLKIENNIDKYYDSDSGADSDFDSDSDSGSDYRT